VCCDCVQYAIGSNEGSAANGFALAFGASVFSVFLVVVSVIVDFLSRLTLRIAFRTVKRFLLRCNISRCCTHPTGMLDLANTPSTNRILGPVTQISLAAQHGSTLRATHHADASNEADAVVERTDAWSVGRFHSGVGGLGARRIRLHDLPA